MPGDHGVVNPKDGNAVLIDDDGVGYIAYTAITPFGPHPPNRDHLVAIERLTPDLKSSTKQQVGSLFHEDFVEGVMIFKRRGFYYVIFSSCCCACRWGSGAVVHRARNISGPWERQSRDVNCNTDAPICAAGVGFTKENRSTDINVHAQGLGLSVIGEQVLWHGERWLSAPDNPSNCTSLCNPPTGVCAEAAGYDKGADFTYWVPLEFGEGGEVGQFAGFVDSFELTLG